MDIIKKYDTPLKFTYLPQISNQIKKAKAWFKEAMEKVNYKGIYHYCYFTKSSHFKHVLHEALKHDINIETSSAYDINIVEALFEDKKITKSNYIICNGFKRDAYIENIAKLINNGFSNTIPIIDNYEELDRLESHIVEIRQVLQSHDAVGRRLDFLMQELNRDANTLGSKSADAETSKDAVDLKVLIEQMREQIQNVE